ncbi:MAG: hypothetical protein CMH56_07000 [Myxococcales bacterium]|nr:hypothetical protein [Myxococcales bacterium]|tara:strand:- start:247 stop:1422 length:1176 start_codon:yes stop_codon:yes gene_type:complete
MAEKTAQEYQAEIDRLKKELEQVKTAAAMPITGTLAVGGRTASHTVFGIEEMLLQVNADDTVGYVNSQMAKLLEMPDRKLVLGTSLSRWDEGKIGSGVLAALVRVARSSSEPHVLERNCPDVPPSLLPESKSERPLGDPILRFAATAAKGSVHITAQDVTVLRWLEGTFSRYVSPAVIEQMQHLESGELLSTERKELTILFADLRGFTAISQELPPEEVQEMVNSFLSNMVACVEKLEGTVDKFVGDEIMVLFGAPMPQPDHALRALICGVEMQRVHNIWMAKRNADNKPARSMGIGIATGPVVVGNIGTETRMDYTVLGHHVNLAARLCGKAEGGEVLTVPNTHQAGMNAAQHYQGTVPIPRLSFKAQGKMEFKNVHEPIDVISVSTSQK